MTFNFNRKKLALWLWVLALPILAWSFTSFESRALYHPEMSEFPDDPAHFLSYSTLLKDNVVETRFESDPGVKLYAWYLPAQPGKLTVLFAHGNGGHLGDRWLALNALAERGYGVFAVDYRGFGKSTGASSEAGLYRDFRAASRYLDETLGVPPERQIAMGESLGGGVMIETATHVPFRAVVVYSTFTSTPEVASYLAQKHGWGWLAWLPDQIMQQRYPSLARAQRIQTPMLIVHGENDEMMPPSMPEKLYEAAGSEHKQLLFIPYAGHNTVFHMGRDTILDALDRLLAESEVADEREAPSVAGAS